MAQVFVPDSLYERVAKVLGKKGEKKTVKDLVVELLQDWVMENENGGDA